MKQVFSCLPHGPQWDWATIIALRVLLDLSSGSLACVEHGHGLLPKSGQHVWPKHAVGAHKAKGDSHRSCAAGSGSGGCEPCLPHSGPPGGSCHPRLELNWGAWSWGCQGPLLGSSIPGTKGTGCPERWALPGPNSPPCPQWTSWPGGPHLARVGLWWRSKDWVKPRLESARV